MKKIWQLVLAVLAAIWAPQSWAAAATAATAGATAALTGIDPWPWVIGGFGGAIVYVKKPASTRLDAAANSLISVIIGGIVAPFAASMAAEYVSPKAANTYAFAFVLSAAWPWLVPMLFAKLQQLDPTAAKGLGKD